MLIIIIIKRKMINNDLIIKYKFDAAHLVDNAYSSECSSTIHGHTWAVEITFTGKVNQETGMIIDFKKIKKYVEPIIMDLDHSLMLWEKSWLIKKLKKYKMPLKDLSKKIRIFPTIPTAENLSRYLFYKIDYILREVLKEYGEGFSISKLKLCETENNCIEVENDYFSQYKNQLGNQLSDLRDKNLQFLNKLSEMIEEMENDRE